jgi:hypothetical protein
MQSILNNTRKADITFHGNGRIDITSAVSVSLGLAVGDVIDICTNGYGQYFLVVAHKGNSIIGKYQAKVYATKKGKRHNRNLRAYSVRLCRAMMRLHGDGSRDVAFAVSEPMPNDTYGLVLPIITRLNLYKDDKGDKL